MDSQCPDLAIEAFDDGALAQAGGAMNLHRLVDDLLSGVGGVEFGRRGLAADPCGAGVANLELIDRLGLIDNVRDVGPYLLAVLRHALAEHRVVGEVRGDGLLAAVEFTADTATGALFDPELKVGPRIAAALAARSVIGRAMPHGDVVGFAPPLCLTRSEADTIITATAEAVAEVAAVIP